jgi:hypothetical protein
MSLFIAPPPLTNSDRRRLGRLSSQVYRLMLDGDPPAAPSGAKTEGGDGR